MRTSHTSTGAGSTRGYLRVIAASPWGVRRRSTQLRSTWSVIWPSGAQLLAAAVLLVLGACDGVGDNDSTDLGDWVEVSSFEGVARSNAVSFVIDGRGYVGTGYDGDDRLQDFWEYNPEQNFWVQKANVPGPARSAAVGFATGGQGYLGTGYNPDVDEEYLGDFYRYDPQTNTWERIADFAGSARYGAVAFSVAGRGYVGTGYDDNNLKDFWAYDPATGAWNQIVSLPGDKRINAVAFVIDNRAYVGTGRNNGRYEEDFWAYDPATEAWTAMRDIDEDEDEDSQPVPRENAVSFALNGLGYVALGEVGGLRTDIWEYDPVSDTWIDRAGYEARERTGAIAFAIGNLAYVGTGSGGAIRYDDMWSFDPSIENIDDDD